MDFWCHASALFAELGERATPTSSSDACSWRAAAAAVRTAASPQRFPQSTQRDTVASYSGRPPGRRSQPALAPAGPG